MVVPLVGVCFKRFFHREGGGAKIEDVWWLDVLWDSFLGCSLGCLVFGCSLTCFLGCFFGGCFFGGWLFDIFVFFA